MKSWIWLVAFSLLTSAIASDSRAQEGIRVHGDWTVVIRDADGHILKRHQFSNQLVKCPPCRPLDGGKLLLTVLRIYKSRSPNTDTSTWRINLFVGGTKLSIEDASLGAATDPPNRVNSFEGNFTQTTPNPPITVNAGQLLDVKVVISFL
jgi:hypothetical protein